MNKTILVDFDNTLHNTDLKFHQEFDGLFGLNGRELWDIFFLKIHREIVHGKYLNKHSDITFHIELLFKHLGLCSG